MIYLTTYLIIGFIYGCYTMFRINQKWLGLTFKDYVINFFLNLLIWPASLVIALKKKDLWKKPGEVRSFPSCEIKQK